MGEEYSIEEFFPEPSEFSKESSDKEYTKIVDIDSIQCVNNFDSKEDIKFMLDEYPKALYGNGAGKGEDPAVIETRFNEKY